MTLDDTVFTVEVYKCLNIQVLFWTNELLGPCKASVGTLTWGASTHAEMELCMLGLNH